MSGTTIQTPAVDDRLVRVARRWADFYWSRGWQPLPSRPDAKRPMCRFAGWWDGGGPHPEWLWDRFPTSNIQIMTGRAWKLAVIDLDGQEAIDHWPTLGPTLPRTWVSSSGGGGRHIWFTLPDGLADPLPKRRLWGVWDAELSAWTKHKAIELLGDRSLVIAPPSVHPETGKVYQFHAGHSPREIARPAMLPAWVLKLPTAEAPREVQDALERPPVVARPFGGPMPSVSIQDVLDAIPDKSVVARTWGLRIATRVPNAAGWLQAHDFDREDANPSASFSPSTGCFWRPGMAHPMSLFSLGVALGYHADWKSAFAELASIFLPQRSHHAGNRS